jgi:hypothetical protein
MSLRLLLLNVLSLEVSLIVFGQVLVSRITGHVTAILRLVRYAAK